MPAAMVHGGCGVLFMMTTKFKKQETYEEHKTKAKKTYKAPFFTTISNSKQHHKITSRKKP